MIFRSSKTIRIGVLGVLLALAFPFGVFAQSPTNSNSFSVSPTIFDMTADPGQKWSSTMRVINANPYELTVYIQVLNFKPKEESGVPSFIPEDLETDISANFAKWITTEESLTIPPERTVELPLQISVPVEAQPGGHYAAVLIGTRPPDTGSDKPQVQTSQVISSLLFLRVTGDVKEFASIRSFRTTDYVLERPETTFEVRIENKGNVYLQPRGEIKIYNMWGQERGVIPVNQYTLFGNVLSNSIRKYSFDWKGEWSLADIGRYTAETTLTYGYSNKQFMTSETAFWVFPWKIMAVIVLVLYGFFRLFAWGIKAYIRRMLSMAGVPTRDGYQTSPVRRNVSVTAPIEAGMLDLRSRFSRTESSKNYVKEVIEFIKAYWKFFAVALGVIVFVVVLIMFFKSALQSEKAYEVTTDSGEVVTSEEMKMNQESKIEERAATSSDSVEEPFVTLVNKSGTESLVTDIKELLDEKNLPVNTVEQDSVSTELRTVIVFSPTVTELALEFSKALNNAPLSALPDTPEEQPEITIYLGADSRTLIE